MEWTDRKDTVALFLKKHRWAALVLLAGLLLMTLPESHSEESKQIVKENVNQENLQQELEDILTKLDGAGKVSVLLSTASGAETYYQTDDNLTQMENTQEKRIETVIIASADRTEMGLVQRTDPPVYLGALILCQGADRPQVRLAVVDAVSTITGLTTDKIAVLKMK